MHAQSFRISGEIVTLISGSRRQAGRLRELVMCLFDADPVPGHFGPHSIVLDLAKSDSQRPSPSRPEECLFQSHGLIVSQTGGAYRLQCGSSTLHIDLESGQAMGVLAGDFWQYPMQSLRAFLFLPLLLMFPRRGLYGIHAAGLEKDGIGFLLAGDSGQGKTTLSLALLRSGWNYVSDDTVMLAAAAGEVRAHSFRRGFACDATILDRFPELRSCRGHSDWSTRKVLVGVDLIYSARHKRSCVPRVLIFPEISAEPASRLLPLDVTTTVARLIRHSPFGVAGRSTTVTQLSILRALATRCSSYRFVAGADVFQTPGAASALLCQALQAGECVS